MINILSKKFQKEGMDEFNKDEMAIYYDGSKLYYCSIEGFSEDGAEILVRHGDNRLICTDSSHVFVGKQLDEWYKVLMPASNIRFMYYENITDAGILIDDSVIITSVDHKYNIIAIYDSPKIFMPNKRAVKIRQI